jgi:hypothetical protein
MQGIAKRSLVTPFAALAVAVTGFASATSALAQLDPRPGSTTPVQIMGPLPVPVIGAVSGQVSVTGTVGLAPGSSVTVANPATNPVLVRNADEPPRVPYQIMVKGGDPQLPAVPAGKRLVIQNISARTFTNGQGMGMMKFQMGSPSQEYVFPMTFGGTSGAGNLWVGNVPTLIFVDSGRTGRQFLFESATIGAERETEAMVSGYLLDCSASCPPIAP